MPSSRELIGNDLEGGIMGIVTGSPAPMLPVPQVYTPEEIWTEDMYEQDEAEEEKYRPDQLRDAHGRWTDEGIEQGAPYPPLKPLTAGQAKWIKAAKSKQQRNFRLALMRLRQGGSIVDPEGIPEFAGLTRQQAETDLALSAGGPGPSREHALFVDKDGRIVGLSVSMGTYMDTPPDLYGVLAGGSVTHTHGDLYPFSPGDLLSAADMRIGTERLIVGTDWNDVDFAVYEVRSDLGDISTAKVVGGLKLDEAATEAWEQAREDFDAAVEAKKIKSDYRMKRFESQEFVADAAHKRMAALFKRYGLRYSKKGLWKPGGGWNALW